MDTCVQINGMSNLNSGACQGLTHVPTQQDCVAVIPPLPFFTDPPDKFDMETRLDDFAWNSCSRAHCASQDRLIEAFQIQRQSALIWR